MRNNAEIRQRMDTYRIILLVINWVFSFAGIIVGIVLMNLLEGFAILIIIAAIFIGIIGHFLTNVTLSIPFILLNNGDNVLEALNKKNLKESISTSDFISPSEKKKRLENIANAFQVPKGLSDQNNNDIEEGNWKCPNCGFSNPNDIFTCKKCNYKIV